MELHHHRLHSIRRSQHKHQKNLSFLIYYIFYSAGTSCFYYLVINLKGNWS